MKSLSIRLPDVEAAMLAEIQKTNKVYRDIQAMLLVQIRDEYQKIVKK